MTDFGKEIQKPLHKNHKLPHDTHKFYTVYTFT